MFRRKKHPAQAVIEANRAVAQEPKNPAEDKVVRKETAAFFNTIRAFETDRVALAQRHARIAWRLCAVFGVLAVLAVAAVVGLTPLKTVAPYVIRVDNNTGAADVATPVGNRKTTYGRELDKYWLSQFVINRESYEWESIQTMFNSVKLLSNGDVFKEYEGIVRREKTGVLALLKDTKKVMVRITSVSFIDTAAQVRFIKYVKNPDGTDAPEYPRTSWIATLVYDYKKPVKLERDRLVNPLGFQVISYRVDPEATGGR